MIEVLSAITSQKKAPSKSFFKLQIQKLNETFIRLKTY